MIAPSVSTHARFCIPPAGALVLAVVWAGWGLADEDDQGYPRGIGRNREAGVTALSAERVFHLEAGQPDNSGQRDGGGAGEVAANHRHGGKGADQRDRHGKRRNQRRPDVLQEDEDDEKDETVHDEVVGRRVYKEFKEGWFWGTVARVRQPKKGNTSSSPTLYLIQYDDGDEEEVKISALQELLDNAEAAHEKKGARILHSLLSISFSAVN